MERALSVSLVLGLVLSACTSSQDACPQPSDVQSAATPAQAKPDPADASPSKSETPIPAKLMEIEEARDACIAKEPPTAGWLYCFHAASMAHYELLPKTRTHEDLERLFTMLADPMEYEMGGGEALFARKVAGGSFEQLSHGRVILLTDASARGPTIAAGSLDPGPRLGWLKDRALAAEADKLWISIRDRDCKAYPVPRCADRLDALFRDLIDRTVVDISRLGTEG